MDFDEQNKRQMILEARIEGMQNTLRLIENHLKWIGFCVLIVTAIFVSNEFGWSFDKIRELFN